MSRPRLKNPLPGDLLYLLTEEHFDHRAHTSIHSSLTGAKGCAQTMLSEVHGRSKPARWKTTTNTQGRVECSTRVGGVYDGVQMDIVELQLAP